MNMNTIPKFSDHLTSKKMNEKSLKPTVKDFPESLSDLGKFMIDNYNVQDVVIKNERWLNVRVGDELNRELLTEMLSWLPFDSVTSDDKGNYIIFDIEG